MKDRTPEALLASYRLRIRVQKKRLEPKGRYALFLAHASFGSDFKVRVKVRRHKTDPSICLEGIRSPVPPGYQPCCDYFEYHLYACVYDIRYTWGRRSKTWGIMIADIAGGGNIAMFFCPHCGAKLPGTSSSKSHQGRFIEI